MGYAMNIGRFNVTVELSVSHAFALQICGLCGLLRGEIFSFTHSKAKFLP